MHGFAASSAFPGFLRALARVTEPAAALTAALDGPLHAYRVTGGFLALVVDESLQIEASARLPVAFTDRYRVMPVGHTTPMTAALHRLDLVHAPVADIAAAYPALAIDEGIWSSVLATAGADASFLVIPIWVGERIGGVLGFFTAEPTDVDDAGVLQGAAAALGLWLGSRERDMGGPSYSASSGEVPLVLSPRQREILRLVEQGKSNPVIAATLGFSLATVKAELARIMRMLRAPNRRAAVAIAKRLGVMRSD